MKSNLTTIAALPRMGAGFASAQEKDSPQANKRVTVSLTFILNASSAPMLAVIATQIAASMQRSQFRGRHDL